mmetsp:Transcript_115493/g.322873  ORF Transcript_115493/g.322873 Transcript_115493/m.322873 type:complete len:224 (+) Transcript_115493:1428-2099(+)
MVRRGPGVGALPAREARAPLREGRRRRLLDAVGGLLPLLELRRLRGLQHRHQVAALAALLGDGPLRALQGHAARMRPVLVHVLRHLAPLHDPRGDARAGLGAGAPRDLRRRSCGALLPHLRAGDGLRRRQGRQAHPDSRGEGGAEDADRVPGKGRVPEKGHQQRRPRRLKGPPRRRMSVAGPLRAAPARVRACTAPQHMLAGCAGAGLWPPRAIGARSDGITL